MARAPRIRLHVQNLVPYTQHVTPEQCGNRILAIVDTTLRALFRKTAPLANEANAFYVAHIPNAVVESGRCVLVAGSISGTVAMCDELDEHTAGHCTSNTQYTQHHDSKMPRSCGKGDYTLTAVRGMSEAIAAPAMVGGLRAGT